MSATKLDAVAVAVKAAIDTAAITADGSALKVYDYGLPVSAIDRFPAVTLIGPISMSRVPVDEPDSQLGSYDWKTSWQLDLWVRFDGSEDAQREIRNVLGQVVAAIDADYTLGGTAEIGASLENAELVEVDAEDAGGRQLARYRGDLIVHSLIEIP